jgi:hypothetical protein
MTQEEILTYVNRAVNAKNFDKCQIWLEALMVRLREEKPLSPWQPIKTAPRDETVVWFYTPFPMGDIVEKELGLFWERLKSEGATHWCPLASIPEPKEK